MAATALGDFAVSWKPAGVARPRRRVTSKPENLGQAFEQARTGPIDFDLGVTVLALIRGTYFSPERVDHVLKAVADAKHGKAESEDLPVGTGASVS